MQKLDSHCAAEVLVRLQSATVPAHACDREPRRGAQALRMGLDA